MNDLWVCPILRANKLTPDDAFAVYDIRFGPHVGVKKVCSGLARIAHCNEVYVVGLQEFGVGAWILINADGEDDDVRILVVELKERRHLFNTRGAPGSPEVEQYHLTAITAQMDGCIAVRNSEVWRHKPRLGRMGTAIASSKQGSGSNSEKSKAV